MNKDWSITQEVFDKFLAWLAPGRDDAGKKYEMIRRGLIKIFICRGCTEAEELADETINRVASKIESLSESYVGDPTPYFYGVARNVYMESLRKRRKPIELPPVDRSDEDEIYDCLDHCMQRLHPDQGRLILQYYQENKKAKIDHRKELAKVMGLAPNALRIRAHRLRAKLHQCVQKCLDQKRIE